MISPLTGIPRLRGARPDARPIRQDVLVVVAPPAAPDALADKSAYRPDLLAITVPPFEPTHLRLMYEQVAEHIQARIDAGELRPGQKMAPERDLAEEYGVAYNTVRKSVELLRERGLIVTMHGRGTYVAERPASTR